MRQSWVDYQDQHHRPGFIYLIHQTGTNRYKIGLTSNPDKRLKQLQTGSSDELVFVQLTQTSDMSQSEKYMHELFARQRIRGEWFRFQPHELGGVIGAMGDSKSVCSESVVKPGRMWIGNLALAGLVAAVCLLLLWWESDRHQYQRKPHHLQPVSATKPVRS